MLFPTGYFWLKTSMSISIMRIMFQVRFYFNCEFHNDSQL